MVLCPRFCIWEVEIEAVEINQDAFLDTPEDDATFALVVTGSVEPLAPRSPSPTRMGP